MTIGGGSIGGGNGGGINFSFSEQDTGLKSPAGKKIFQLSVDISTMPNAMLKSVAHGIGDIDADSIKLVANGTSINNGAGTDTFPLPAVYNTAIGNQIRLDFDATNVNVDTSINYSAYTGIVCFQYEKT